MNTELKIDRRQFLLCSSALALPTLAVTATDNAKEPSLPRNAFGVTSTAEEVTAGIDLSGKTALLTGCASGIGYETLRVLALRGAHVLASDRTLEKARKACESAVAAGAKGRATPFGCEQSNFESVVAYSEAIRKLGKPIDMLICNAGVAFNPKLTLYHGVDEHFAINHLSHFILVNRLLPQVKRAPQGRIVVVGSIAYMAAPDGIAFDNLAGQLGYDRFKSYGQSKLANGLFTRELAKKLAGTTTTANVVHPGTVQTNIFVHFDEAKRPKAGQGEGKTFVKNVQQGAATTCYVATSRALDKVSGAYFEDCNVVIPGGQMRNDAMAAKLWTVSEELTRPYLTET